MLLEMNPMSVITSSKALIEKLQPVILAEQNENMTQLTADSIPYLVKALVFADSAFASEIEAALVQCGKKAVPFLVEGLSSDHNQVASTCAMSLIRLGSLAEPVFCKTLMQLSKMSPVAWRFAFVKEQLKLTDVLVESLALQAANAERIK